MGGLLERLRKLVVPAAAQQEATQPATAAFDEKIALGVLLWIVAEADGRFLDEERAQIGQVLSAHGGVGDADLAVVMAAVEQAAKDRIDMYAFTREVAHDLSPASRIEIVRHLYRVACADRSLVNDEVEVIRKISGLLRVDHQDFIAAKLAAMAEFEITR